MFEGKNWFEPDKVPVEAEDPTAYDAPAVLHERIKVALSNLEEDE
jgi:hypothetical protein